MNLTGGNWDAYWQDARNLHWGELDKHVLRVVADAMGWGPDRSLIELGGGRGQHSRNLYLWGRCGYVTLLDPSTTAGEARSTTATTLCSGS